MEVEEVEEEDQRETRIFDPEALRWRRTRRVVARICITANVLPQLLKRSTSHKIYENGRGSECLR